MQGSGPKKNALVLSVQAGYIEIPEKTTEKKHTLSSERNWYLEVGHGSHLLEWQNGKAYRAKFSCEKVHSFVGFKTR